MMWIVDMQGFNYGHENDGMKFMCKELTLINCSNGQYMHKFIRLPIDVQMFNRKIQNHIAWLTDHIHGLEWKMTGEDCKFLNYEDLVGFLKGCILENDTVAVKGSCKKKWLSGLISNEIIDFSDEGCPPFRELKNTFKSHHCNEHLKNNMNCTLENVLFLYYWYLYCKNK